MTDRPDGCRLVVSHAVVVGPTSVEEDRPICNSSSAAKQQFATPKVAHDIKEHARSHDRHREWIVEYAENWTLAEIRETLDSAY